MPWSHTRSWWVSLNTNCLNSSRKTSNHLCRLLRNWRKGWKVTQSNETVFCMDKEGTKQKPNDGLIARILGGTPTILQKVFFILMVSSLILWPLGCYVSIFFFDAPIRSYIDEICRFGMVLTIWLYPIYLLPLLRFMFQLSKKLRATWLYYLCPIVPILILRLFLLISTIWSSYQKNQFTNGKSMPFVKTEPIYSTRDLKKFFNENNKWNKNVNIRIKQECNNRG